MYDVVDHFAKLCRGDNLRLFVQSKIFDKDKLFQNLSTRRTRSDAASLNLFAQLLVFNELSGIFHCKDHRTGGVAFWRRGFSFLDRKAEKIQLAAFLQLGQRCKKRGIASRLVLLSALVVLLFLTEERILHGF